MMKVLIADDEIKVCQLISHLIDWQAFGLEVAGIVNDGKSAFQFICEKKPDIVVTDIRMPNYDGIELVKRSKELFPDIHFIIISGYSHFEYAQNAIKYGVEDYLLKPLKKKELEGTLNKILDKHSAMQNIASEREKLQSLVQHAEEKVRKNLVADMVMNPGGLEQFFSMETVNQEYHCHFTKGFYAVLKIQPFLTAEIINEEAYALLLSKLQAMVGEKLAACCEELVMSVNENAVLCIINIKDPSLTEVKRQLNKVKNDVTNLREIFEEIRVIMGFSSVVDDIKELFSCLSEADVSVLNRFSEPGKNIMEFSSYHSANVTATELVDQKYRNDLLGSMEVFDSEGILSKLKALGERLEQYSYDGKLIYDCYLEIVGIFIFGMKNGNIEFDFPNTNWFIKKYNQYMSTKEAFDGLQKDIRLLYEKFEENRKMADYKPIRMAKQYINDNYNTALTLESVSTRIGFNPAYFSALFKKETGKNFMEYIMEVRVQNAKQQLVQTGRTVDEIAMEVGYSDIKYFSRLFKKITGLNPSEYRKLYS